MHHHVSNGWNRVEDDDDDGYGSCGIGLFLRLYQNIRIK